MFIERRNKEDNLYEHLQNTALEKIQALSGNTWTDYNPHDPGITILDILHYSLYELNYLGEFPFQDYLKNSDKETAVDYEKLGLFSPEKLFAPSLVTAQDYELLFTRNFEAIRACRVRLTEKKTYRVSIEVAPGTDQEQLRREVEALYHANRNLCETLEDVVFETIRRKRRRYAEQIEAPECDTERGMPEVTHTDTPAYRSIQYDFPDNYGINERGKPTGISMEHRARIMQLEGYLLLYDFLLGRTVRQINDIPRLLEFSGRMPADTYPDMDIEDADLLIDRARQSEAAVRDEAFPHQQESRFLDLLDLLYGEDTNILSSVGREQGLPEKNRKRIHLIDRLPTLNANRFRSFNILDRSANNVPVVKQTIAAILEYTVYAETSVTNLFSRYNLRLISDEQFFHDYRTLLNVEFLFEDIERNWSHEVIEKVPRISISFNERRFYAFKRQLNLFWHNVLFESFLQYGTSPEYYRMVYLDEKNGYLLLFKHSGMKQWINMGFFFEKNTLIDVTNLLWIFLEKLNNQSSSFYLLEHILLEQDEADDSHLLSVIIPAWNERFYKREKYEQLLIERLPAHLTIQCLWLNANDMYRFEKIYFEWRRVLIERDKIANRKLSDEMRRFIGYQTGLL